MASSEISDHWLDFTRYLLIVVLPGVETILCSLSVSIGMNINPFIQDRD